ncbi:hypothetical protein CI41S_39820 [Bradyrhizobium ivorense]|nr:hypothetical protein CI41S_39820 [Bradyrhizobium ivorense]
MQPIGCWGAGATVQFAGATVQAGPDGYVVTGNGC